MSPRWQRLRRPPPPTAGSTWDPLVAFAVTVALIASAVLAIGSPITGVPPAGGGSRPLAAGESPGAPSVASPAGGASAVLRDSPAASPAPRAGFTLTVGGATPSGISLAWGATNDIFFSSYSVLVSAQGPTGPWTNVGVVTSQSTTQFATFGLQPGATYWWEVTESGSVGSQTTNIEPFLEPTLAYLTWTQPTSSSVRLNWTNNASYGGLLSFASYNLYEIASGGHPAAVATSSNASRTSATITGLTSGSSYAFYLNTTDCISACARSAPSVIESNTVTFGTVLPLVASIAAGRAVVDAGQFDTFFCAPSGGQSPFRFSWDYGNGTYAAGGSSVSHAFADPGPVTVTCLVNDSLSTISTAATTVNVVAALTVAVSANRSAVDVGQAVGFSCQPSQGASPVAVEWTLGDGANASGRTATHAYAAAGTEVATCTATDGAGFQRAASVQVVVSPALEVTASLSSLKVAPSISVTFRATPSGGSGTYGPYLWQFGDGVSATSASAVHGFSAPGNFTVTIRVGDSNGATALQSSLVVVSHVQVLLLSSIRSAQVGASVNFTATASGGDGGPYTYLWEFGDGSHATGASVHHAYSGPGVNHPTLTVTDALGGSTTLDLPAVTVTSPSEWFIDFGVPALLLAAVAIGVGVGFLQYRRARSRTGPGPGPLAGWVPPAGPDAHARGIRLCPSCGAANLPIRSSCATCGRRLPRLLPKSR